MKRHFIATVCALATASLLALTASADQNTQSMNQQQGGQDTSQPQYGASQSQAQSNQTQSNQQQSMGETHRMMAESYLKASQVFADGLDNLLSSNVPLNSKFVQDHINNYIKGTLENLQQARTHIREFASMSRMPASAGSTSQDKSQNVTQVSQDIDRAIQAANTLKKNDWKTSQKDNVQKQVSELRDQIRSAMSDQKNLKQSS